MFMENVVKMPVDLQQLPPFKSLVVALGSPVSAVYVWFSVWRELLYRQQEGGAPGRISRAEARQFLQLATSDAKISEESIDPILSALFSADGDELMSLRYITLHAGATPSGRSMAQRGGDLRAYNMRMQKAQSKAFQQSLQIAGRKFVDAEGNPLNAETTQRVTRVIIACDNALFQEERAAFEYREGLIQLALEVASKYTDDEINQICTAVARKRGHPALSSMRTERLLERFGDIVGELER